MRTAHAEPPSAGLVHPWHGPSTDGSRNARHNRVVPARFRAETPFAPSGVPRCPLVTDVAGFEELRAHLVSTTSLSPGETDRVIAEVLAYFDEDVQAYVRRRHTELQSRGIRNDEAFTRISSELGRRLFSAPALSLRQLRRIVYT
jgi:hypothetical protein